MNNIKNIFQFQIEKLNILQNHLSIIPIILIQLLLI